MVCALVLVTGCGGKDEPSSEPEVKLGMITHLNATEQKVGELYNALVEKAGLKLAKYVPMFFVVPCVKKISRSRRNSTRRF